MTFKNYSVKSSNYLSELDYSSKYNLLSCYQQSYIDGIIISISTKQFTIPNSEENLLFYSKLISLLFVLQGSYPNVKFILPNNYNKFNKEKEDYQIKLIFKNLSSVNSFIFDDNLGSSLFFRHLTSKKGTDRFLSSFMCTLGSFAELKNYFRHNGFEDNMLNIPIKINFIFKRF